MKTMDNTLWEQAEQLAARPYRITYEQDTLSNGQVVFLARHPELPGYKAQGSSKDEVKQNAQLWIIDASSQKSDSEEAVTPSNEGKQSEYTPTVLLQGDLVKQS